MIEEAKEHDMRRLGCMVAIVVLCIWLPTVVMADQYEDGDDAERRVRLVLRPLAEKGDANVQHELGQMYMEGRGVLQDFAEVLKWQRMAAKQGHAGAMAALGYMYKMGFGVEQNRAEALRWYKKTAEQYRMAAENGDVQAMYILGLMYSSGESVTRDLLKAHMWLNIAGSKGVGKARKTRVMLAKLMKPAWIATAQKWAREWVAKHDRN
jgi:uncharacterized protein